MGSPARWEGSDVVAAGCAPAPAVAVLARAAARTVAAAFAVAAVHDDFDVRIVPVVLDEAAEAWTGDNAVEVLTAIWDRKESLGLASILLPKMQDFKNSELKLIARASASFLALIWVADSMPSASQPTRLLLAAIRLMEKTRWRMVEGFCLSGVSAGVLKT